MHLHRNLNRGPRKLSLMSAMRLNLCGRSSTNRHHPARIDRAERGFGMKFGKIPANRRLTLVGAALCLGLVAVAPQARAAGGEIAVRSLYDTLLANMRSGPSLGASGRYARIEPVVRRVFDIQFMTRLAVGPEWTNLTEAQRQQVSQAFERYIAAIYAERFDNYSGEQLKVVGEQNSPGGTIITSQIVKSNGEPVNINYLMRQNGSSWQIAGQLVEQEVAQAEQAHLVRLDAAVEVSGRSGQTTAVGPVARTARRERNPCPGPP